MKTIKIAVSIFVLLFVSGCVTLPDLTPTPREPEPTPLVMETDSLAQICKEVKTNELRANDRYEGKGLTVKGKISIIEHDRLQIDVGKVFIAVYPKNKQALKHVSMGQTITVTGVIESVFLGYYDYTLKYNPCGIRLKDATF